MSEASNKMREEWTRNDAIRDQGLTQPEDIIKYDGMRYGQISCFNLLDVYRPKKAEGKLPVIVNVHGGGWVYGDKELYQFYGMTLAQRGFAVVNFSYRLAPEWKFPAQVEDMNHVIQWMYDNQDQYGLDMEHVFMVGDSAGGHLCGLYSNICTNPDFAAKFDFHVPNSFSPTAVALNCGAYVPIGEERDIMGASQDEQLMGDLLPNKGTPEEADMMNVARHVTSAFPPAYLMTAVGDFCRPQAPLMEKALKENHVQYVFKTYGTEEKPLYHVFHVTIQEEMGQKCNDDECDFFRSFL